MSTKLTNYFALFCFAASLMFAGRAMLSSDSSGATADRITQISEEHKTDVATVPIEELSIGMRVLAHNPEESDEDRST